MYEKQKVAEARYFLSRMETERPEPEAFKHNLSAFLSASRSVMQYALREAQQKAGGRAWYDNEVAAHPLLGFFTSERNINTHHVPIQPAGQVDVYAIDRAHMTEDGVVELFDLDGNLIDAASAAEQGAIEPDVEEYAIRYVYRFATWQEPEDVIGLCRDYLGALETLVEHGRAQLLISSPS